jgi:hypothetical protein
MVRPQSGSDQSVPECMGSHTEAVSSNCPGALTSPSG